MDDLNILILEDITSDVELIELALKKGKLAFDSKWVKNKREFENALKTFHPDLILANDDLASFNASDVFKIANLKVPDTPFICVSREPKSRKALKRREFGPTDYVLKDKLSRLPLVVRRALGEAKAGRQKALPETGSPKSNNQLKNILKSVGMITWEWHIADNIVKFGEGLHELFGCGEGKNGLEPEVLKGMIHADDLPEMLHNLAAHLNGAKAFYAGKYRVRHRNGTWVPVSDRGKVTMTDPVGKPLVMSGVLTSFPPEAENRLYAPIAKEEKEKSWILLDSVYKTVPTAVTFLDHEFKIVSANKVLCMLTGLPLAQHYGKHFKDVIPEIAKKSETFLRRVVKSGRPIFDFEITGRTPVSNNGARNFLVSFYPLRSGDHQMVGVTINDITPVKVAEAARFESEMRFRQIEENLNVVTWTIEAGTNKLQYISPSYENFWGLTSESLYDDPFSFVEKVHAEDQEYVEQFLISLLNSEKPGLKTIEFRFATRGERLRWLSGKGFTIPDKNGNVKSYGLLMQDITKRKLLQEELLESQNMLSETQKIVHLGSFEWNIADNKVFWSDQLFRIFGYSPRQFPTAISSYMELSYREDQELIRKAIKTAIFKKEGFELEHRIALSDGTIRVVSLTVRVKTGEEGQPVQLIGLVQDITDKKQAEEVAQRFGRILDNALNELYIFREDTLHFIQASKSALQNLGYEMDELKQLTPLDLKIGLDEEKMAQWVSALKSGEKEGIVFESTHRRKDGTTYPVEARLQYLRSETPPVFLAEVSDISEHRKTQQARYEGQEMERKRIAMEIHDGIGQMLIAIKQRVLNLDFESAEREELEEKISEIDKILSMTIEEARRTSNNLAPIVLKKMGIEDAIEMLCNQTAKVSNTNILFDHKGPKIRAGENILLAVYRILQEALNNLVKHSQASQAKVQFFRDKKSICLIIADNGIGFNLNGNLRKGSNGLNNMRERASLVNGDFYIETKENAGTYIKVDIPFDPND